ncbi:MAG: hypothetical protein CMJ49_14500 [Planctomycetaceae bacterium]|nr:hypothetical protein [Planctomycetaceae bacterium]
MQPAHELRQKVDTGQLTLGTLCTFHCWIGLVELCRDAGLDYLIIDMEHGPFDRQLVVDCCAAGRHINFPVLVRPPDLEISTIRQAIDMGPVGFLLPTVETPEQLDRVRDAVLMPPRGSRRPGGPGNLWVSNVNLQNWIDQVEKDFIVLPQIETRLGLANLDAIAAHEMTYAMAVGPYDLAGSLGCCWDPNDEHRDAMKRIKDAAAAVGKAAWNIGDGPQLRDAGYHFICMGESTMFFQTRLTHEVADVRNGTT